MQSENETKKPRHPRARANFLSAATFCWIIPFFIKGYKDDLREEDLYEALKEHKSAHVVRGLEKAWDRELEKAKSSKKEPSFTRAIIKAFGPKFLLYGIPIFIAEIGLRIGQPLLLGQFLRYFSPTDGRDMTLQEAYMFAAGVIFCSAMTVFIMHPYMLGVLHLGMKLRVAACALIYRKALKLSKMSRGNTSTGQIVTLLSNDVNKFDILFLFLHNLWVGPLQCVIVTYLLWEHVNISSFLGIASLLVFIPFQGFISKLASKYRVRTAMRTDERIRLMNEIISGIQVIKMYSWEQPFEALVRMAREKEIAEIRKMSYVRAILLSLIVFHTRSAIFVTIMSYVLLGGNITAEKVFVLTALFNTLRQTMSVFFPSGAFALAEGLVSSKRIRTFLLYEEHKIDGVTYTDEKVASNGNNNGLNKGSAVDGNPNVGVSVKNASARWTLDSTENTLNDVSLEVGPKEIAVIIGPVGSGKSSLIHVILKELSLSKGSLEVNGTVSYASQEPWLFQGSVRQNILFGSPYDSVRYRRVVKYCALVQDFEFLPFGDQTIVGERGVSLSGGQRARINLARAVYKEADIYLLDDPLSAVDTHVGKHLFEDCILGYLKDKIVILVTHQVQYLDNMEKIIFLEKGSVKATGTLRQFREMKLEYTNEPSSNTEEISDEQNPLRSRQSSLQSVTSHILEGNQGAPTATAETMAQGAVRGYVYSSYFRAGGSCLAILLLIALFIGSQGLASGGDYWISYWVNLEEHVYTKEGQFFDATDLRSNRTSHHHHGHTRSKRALNGTLDVLNSTIAALGTINGTTLAKNVTKAVAAVETALNSSIDHVIATSFDDAGTYNLILSRHECIIVFAVITALTIVVTVFRSLDFFYICMKASIKLHNDMFHSITRATMHFFNTNNSGRILNRFSKDLGIIDEMLPGTCIDVMQIGLALIGIVIMVSISNPWLLIPTACCGVLFFFLRVFYIHTSRCVKRLEGITRSPVFGHLNASVQGITTIRAFKAQEILVREFDNHQDLHSSAFYLFIASSRAFGFWLDVVCSVYIALVALSFLILYNGTAFGGNVGFAITQAIGLTGMFQWGMRQSAELETNMTSVERVLEYSNLESEAELESPPDKKPRPSWPEEGKIVFINLKLRYSAEEPWVLKGLNLTILPQEKVGIVGRTGAGKSSLIAALFNLALSDGRIEIDGIVTTSIGLHELRSKISIIPQEPFLFSSSMRKNLDPFDEFTDDILWNALEEVELKETVQDMSRGLESPIAEGGSNLSVGQRQLVCLARAIIRNNKILVLDEATANVDPRTDSLIQTTIREKFRYCTVLTIAHRLNTVMDCDKILVMSAGNMVEFDHPHILLQNSGGIFTSMLQQTGRSTEERLRSIAAESFQQRTS